MFVWFCSKFRSAVSDNERRKANEEQAAARRRARDLAAARVKTGENYYYELSLCANLI